MRFTILRDILRDSQSYSRIHINGLETETHQNFKEESCLYKRATEVSNQGMGGGYLGEAKPRELMERRKKNSYKRKPMILIQDARKNKRRTDSLRNDRDYLFKYYDKGSMYNA